MPQIGVNNTGMTVERTNGHRKFSVAINQGSSRFVLGSNFPEMQTDYDI